MLTWLKGYRRELLAGDLGAGVLVVLMLVPQGMAYAMVAIGVVRPLSCRNTW